MAMTQLFELEWWYLIPIFKLKFKGDKNHQTFPYPDTKHKNADTVWLSNFCIPKFIQIWSIVSAVEALKIWAEIAPSHFFDNICSLCTKMCHI